MTRSSKRQSNASYAFGLSVLQPPMEEVIQHLHREVLSIEHLLEFSKHRDFLFEKKCRSVLYLHKRMFRHVGYPWVWTGEIGVRFINRPSGQDITAATNPRPC